MNEERRIGIYTQVVDSSRDYEPGEEVVRLPILELATTVPADWIKLEDAEPEEWECLGKGYESTEKIKGEFLKIVLPVAGRAVFIYKSDWDALQEKS